MAFNVAEFRANMIGDGARPNLFSVSLTFPTIAANGSAASSKVTFMAKSAQLPGSTLGTVPVYYFGREMKFAGNRSFADWTLTIINDRLNAETDLKLAQVEKDKSFVDEMYGYEEEKIQRKALAEQQTEAQTQLVISELNQKK